MPYLIGTDEAGYGPRLGPLLISIAVWQVDRSPAEVDLYADLSEAIQPARSQDGDHVTIADSKKLYHSGGSLRLLERAVLSALASFSELPHTWRDAWKILADEFPAALQSRLWYRDYDEPLPIDAKAEEVDQLGKKWKQLWQVSGCKLVALRSTTLFPEELNQQIDALDSKAESLTRATLRLIATTLEQLPDEEAHIVCDKHGGRNHYLPALQRQFPDQLVQVLEESRPQSRYRFKPTGIAAEIQFQRQGESFLPTALASIASKYLRELAMRAWNSYWMQRIENLKPTAGYPGDAARFRQIIEPVCENADLPLHTWWRIR